MRTKILTFLIIGLLSGLISFQSCKKEIPMGKNSSKIQNNISKDTLELREIHRLALDQKSKLKHDSATINFLNLKKIAQQKSNAYFEGISYLHLAEINQRDGKLEPAHAYYEKALQFFSSKKDSVNIKKTYMSYSGFFSQLGDYNQAELFLNDARRYITEPNSKIDSSHILMNFAYLAALQKDTKEAMYMFKKIEKDSVSEHYYHIAKSNIAYLHFITDEFKDAKEIYKELLLQVDVKINPGFYAYISNSYQSLLIKEKSPLIDTAAIFQSLKTRISTANYIGVIESYITITDYYFLKKDTTQAIKSAKIVLNLVKKHNSVRHLPIVYDYLIRLEKPSEVRDLTLDYIQYKDSLEISIEHRTNLFARTNYESELNLHENELLKINTRSHEEKILYAKLYGGFLLLSILVLFLYLFYNYRLQKIKQQNYLNAQIHETEKNISKKVKSQISEGIKNTIHYINTHFTEESPKNKNKLLRKLESVYQLSRDISRENRFLQSEKEFSNEINTMLLGFTSDILEVEIKPYSPKIWKKINIDKRIEIYKVLQELMLAMKEKSEAERIQWEFKVQNQLLSLIYLDHVQAEKVNTGIDLEGIKNIHTRIQKIKGKFQMSENSNYNTEFQIHIPLK